MELTARYQLNGEDGLECFKVHKPGFQVNLILSRVSSAALMVLGLSWLALPGSHALAWVSLGSGATMIVVTWLQRAHMVQEVRKTWSQLGPIELTVREGGLLVTEQGAKSEFTWSRYVRLRESKHHFLLYRSSDIYAIVPKRGFANQEDLDSFRQIATRGIARG